ncbi:MULTISPECIES: hypothetical protein [unclassified Streptomyces]|uniref:hypothetical protein n=1 Tax=unclassified Streptomyces TaxID=2593676 RepID=UPI0011B946FF|nr:MULTISPECIES: hypothetical protein [unclassified Streptomyces]MYT73311.1 hypothetical protein [Streptomyces sp. SID8367]
MTALSVAVVTAGVLAVCLGFAQPESSATAGALVDAGYVVEELPIVAVDDVDAAGSSSRSSTTARYTVELPAADGGGAVPATFRADNGKGIREVGEEYVVAYAPERPRLGAVGDISVEAVEARLDGRALPYRNIPFVAVAWAVAVLLAVAVGTGVASRPRRERRVGGDWVALRATVTGQAEHVEEAAAAVAAQNGGKSGKSGKSAGRYACLMLATEEDGTGAGAEVPLVISAKLSAAAPLVTGTTGWLLWDPRGGGKAKSAAEFVADDGWQLPGRVPGAVAARIAAAPRGPVPIDTGRRTGLLELGAFWPRTVSVGLLVGLLVAAAAVGALLVPVNGGWRVWVALVVVLAPLAGQLVAKDSTGAPVVAVESP